MVRFQHQISVVKFGHAAARPVEPWMPPPQPDQFLMKPIGRPAERRQIGRRRGKRRADRVVASGAGLLAAPKSLLISGIDRRHATTRQKDDERGCEVPLVDELARNPRY